MLIDIGFGDTSGRAIGTTGAGTGLLLTGVTTGMLGTATTGFGVLNSLGVVTSTTFGVTDVTTVTGTGIGLVTLIGSGTDCADAPSATFDGVTLGVGVGVMTGIETAFTIGADVGTLGATGTLKLGISDFTTVTGLGGVTVNSAGAGVAIICVLVFGTDFGIGSLSVKLGAGADGAGATIVGTLAVWTTVGGARTGCPIAAPESRQLMSSTSVVGFPIV